MYVQAIHGLINTTKMRTLCEWKKQEHICSLSFHPIHPYNHPSSEPAAIIELLHLFNWRACDMCVSVCVYE